MKSQLSVSTPTKYIFVFFFNKVAPCGPSPTVGYPIYAGLILHVQVIPCGSTPTDRSLSNGIDFILQRISLCPGIELNIIELRYYYIYYYLFI